MSTLLACPEEEPTPSQKVKLDLSETLKAGEVRCGKVTHEDELIGGIAAYGQVNRGFKCYNNQIRFFIQDTSRPIGNSSYGGSLIDIDLVRDNTPESGEDTFKEMVPAPGAGEVAPESIEVINDGTDGKPATIRITGELVANTLLPSINFVFEPIDGVVQTDYTLHPDVTYIEATTTVFNNSDDFLGPFLMADFVGFGGATALYSPNFGFDDPPLFTDIDFLAGARGDKVNYGYLCEKGPALTPFADKGITTPVCDDEFIVAYEESTTRYIFVGDGNLDSVATPMWRMRGEGLAQVKGTVRDADGNPLANTQVAALTKPLFEAGALMRNQTRSDANGAFAMHLPEGSFFLVAHDLTRLRSEPVQVLTQEGESQEIQLQLQGQGRLQVTTQFSDLGGSALIPHPAKLTVHPRNGAQTPQLVLGDWMDKGITNYFTSADGTFDVNLPPGDYTAYVTRGFTFSRYQKAITVGADETVTFTAQLQRAIDMNGFVSTEFHQHSLGSVDADAPYDVRVMENAAEGIHYSATTDHDNVVDFEPWVQSLGVADFVRIVPGNEVTYTGGIGHFGVFPWNIDPEDPFRDVGSRIWYKTTATSLFERFRELAGDPLIQINHPRSGFSGYFAQMGMDPATGTFMPREETDSPIFPPEIYLDWSNDFEVIEINYNLGDPELFTEAGQATLSDMALNDPSSVPTYADYMALLGSGLSVVAVGNSDSHRPNANLGYPRSFVRVDKTNFADWGSDDVRDALRAQRAGVGQGCMASLKLDDATPMGQGEMLTAEQAGNLRAVIQAPHHVALDRLQLFVNARIQNLKETEDGKLSIDPTGGLSLSLGDTSQNPTTARYEKSLTNLPLDKDLVLILMVRGGSGLHPTGGGTPFCFSGPTYVDVDGDGFDPWLAGSKF
ncbi:MAG: hypothetical protein CMH56_17470 [Myxococcales bacterium]|nr:hypothetical protein [Myxococcales bacterium]|tara:strand:+ start:1880 stop:4573 length:2694 start_codon:yes stop_codon:yes gene_type:complete